MGAVVLMSRYPLTEAKMNELKGEIDALKKRKESNASEV
jgi:Na+/melibiose symporter-like transporter